VTRTFKEDVALIPKDIAETETLKHSITFKYDVRKMDSADYYLNVSLTGPSVDAITITSITPSNLQLTSEMQEVEITIALIEGTNPAVGQLVIQFLFEAVEGIYTPPAEEPSAQTTTFIEDFSVVTGTISSNSSYNPRTFESIEGVEFEVTEAIYFENNGEFGIRVKRPSSQPETFITFTLPNGVNRISVDRARVGSSESGSMTMTILFDGVANTNTDAVLFSNGRGTYTLSDLNITNSVDVVIKIISSNATNLLEIYSIQWEE
jgi:hypothetical protein